jgi:aspartyl-tRNA(Asn)/glutamyl-tRNA(Gln) amidotransferase subunit A
VSELIDLTAAEASARLRSGDTSAGELFEAYRRRAADNDLNAFTWLAEGPPSDPGAGSPLGGVPLAVKDLFCTEGVPSQSGSKILEGYRPPYTATVVQKLSEAGAPLLGKTNQDEFAMGSSNENSAYGPVLNPWDRSRVPGGSSGGRIVGLKPTYGACSRYGMIAFASSLDQAGPLTRNVTDAALLFSHMVGQDHRDSTSVSFPGSIGIPRREDLQGIRLGVPEELLGGAETGTGVEPGVRASFDAALALAEQLGAEVAPCRLPHAQHALSAYYLIAPAEASANLARFDGVRYGLRVSGDADLETMYSQTRAAGFGPEVKRRIMLGTYALSSGYYDAYYGAAQRVRTKIAEDFAAVFADFDFVVTPTSPWVAFPLDSKTGDPLAMYLNDFCTVPMSLAGTPAISLPSGLSDGLPVGFQLAGPAFSEDRLLGAAYALERAIEFDASEARS